MRIEKPADDSRFTLVSRSWSKTLHIAVFGLMCGCHAVGAPSSARAATVSRDLTVQIVAQVRRADYEGDRIALKRLYAQLTLADEDKALGSRIRYWRGFALWRRVINGFNESVDVKEQGEDLTQALEEFSAASRLDPGFIDPKAGEVSCLGMLAFVVYRDQPDRQHELVAQGRKVLLEAQAIDPENPRLLWVSGASVWFTPPEHGGGQDKAIAMYQHGLDVIRKTKPNTDPLEPSWGEPELLMNLAWSNLNKVNPDLEAADRYARSAVAMVPNWHYVKDILIPKIASAREKQQPAARTPAPHNLPPVTEITSTMVYEMSGCPISATAS